MKLKIGTFALLLLGSLVLTTVAPKEAKADGGWDMSFWTTPAWDVGNSCGEYVVFTSDTGDQNSICMDASFMPITFIQ